MTTDLVCPECRGALGKSDSAFLCGTGGHRWPIEEGIADFSGGRYYDQFRPSDVLSDAHLDGLRLEIDGSKRRIVDYYAPLIGPADASVRVLDCGCGNGVSVDLLCDLGFDAWGNDLSALRKWQWRERRWQQRLVVASALSLPFPDGYFDVILSSGVIEHIGVEETAVPRYSVRALPDRREQRIAFAKELMRVLAPGGTLFVDCPNGRFPIDFWHSDAPGRPRFHRWSEPFLPSYREIRETVQAVAPAAEVEALSPYKRLQFRQASQHWYGRLLARPVDGFLELLQRRHFRWLAGSALNPFLVVRVRKPKEIAAQG